MYRSVRHRAWLTNLNQLLRKDPKHPSLHFKRLGRFWSARVGLHYRALAVEQENAMVWFWVGTHALYNRLIGDR